MQENNEIFFKKEKTYSGEFYFPKITTSRKTSGKNKVERNYSGKIKYNANGIFEAALISTSKNLFFGENLTAEYGFATVLDENNKAHYISMKDCYLYLYSQRLGSQHLYFYQLYFKYSLFGNRRFDFKKETNLTYKIYMNTLNDFFSIGNTTEFKETIADFKLKNELEISFKQSILSYWYDHNNNNIFDQIFVSSLSQDKKKEINEKLKEVLSPYIEKIGIKKEDTHIGYIEIKNIQESTDLLNTIILIEHLITCLMRRFDTYITKIEMNRGYDKFYLLFSKNIADIPKQKSKVLEEIRYGNILENMEEIFNNLFSKKKLLEIFFNIICENDINKSKPAVIIFEMAKYVEGLSLISKNRGYENTVKYELVIRDFVETLKKYENKWKINDNIQSDKLLTFLARILKSDKNYEAIGKKISKVRAMGFHFENNMQIHPSNLNVLFKILEIIILDFIYEQLGINENIRGGIIDDRLSLIFPYNVWYLIL